MEYKEYKDYKLTQEQYEYITDSSKADTKLNACAGSGKTFSIILKVLFLIESSQYNPNEILILVFGRFPRDDLIEKVKNVDNNNIIVTNNITTIDALSKHIIDKDNRIDVNLLSYKFLKYLETTSPEELKINLELAKIKCVFVDEAQDLNEINFNIILNLKQKLNIIVNFIGDPNQNIYQFRNSESKYFINYNATQFYFTTNFRSTTEIVDFANGLRMDQNHIVKSHRGSFGLKPKFYITNDLYDIIIYILTGVLGDKLKSGEIDLSDIAILAPTRGKINVYNSYGLCYLANILYRTKIKFKQFYEESKDEQSGNGIEYSPVKGHLNLMTYTSSKGLQWKYVILIDLKSPLMATFNYDQKKFDDEKNLLYVSTTRAMDGLYLIVQPNKKALNINNWFKNIDRNTYDIDSTHHTELIFPPVKFKSEQMIECSITKIIDNFSIQELDLLSQIIRYETDLNKEIIKLYDYEIDTNTNTNKVNPIFLGRFLESYFVICNQIFNKKPKKIYRDIDNLINCKNIIVINNQITYDWLIKNKNLMTWEKYEKIKQKLNVIISNEIDIFKLKINKTDLLELNQYTFIIKNTYYTLYVLNDIDYIKTQYKKYLECDDINRLPKYLFFCEVFEHSINTHHYYHINNKGKKFKNILTTYEPLFKKIAEYVFTNNQDIIIDNNIPISNFGLIGEIDIIDENNKLIELKATQDINLKHILQLLLYNIMTEIKCEYELNFINFLKGEKIKIKLSLSDDDIKKILTMFNYV